MVLMPLQSRHVLVHALLQKGSRIAYRLSAHSMPPEPADSGLHVQQLDERPIFRRKWHNRSKTGCLTCRRRRKKCDEAKPSCTGCVRNRMSCVWTDQSPRSISSPERPAHQPVGSGHDTGVTRVMAMQYQYVATQSMKIRASPSALHADHLRYYCIHIAPGLASNGMQSVWSHLIPQLACLDPAVDASLRALAIAHRVFEYRLPGEPPAKFINSHGNVLRQYDRALNMLVFRINNDHLKDPQSLLVSSLLLFLLECLKGSMRTALVHLRGAIHLVQDMTQIEMRPDNMTQSMLAFRKLNINFEIFIIFERLRIAAGGYFFSEYSDAQNYGMVPFDTAQHFPHMFSSLREAAFSQNVLFTRVRAASFINMTTEQTLDSGLRAVLISDVKLWSMAQLNHLKTLSCDDDAYNEMQVAQMGVNYSFMRLLLLASGPGARDELRNSPAVFRVALQNASRLIQARLNQTEGEKSAPSFGMISCLVPCLWYIAMRTYEPAFRRRAIALLEKADVRECFWDSRNTAQLARQVVANHETQECGVLEESFKSLAVLLEQYHIDDD